MRHGRTGQRRWRQRDVATVLDGKTCSGVSRIVHPLPSCALRQWATDCGLELGKLGVSRSASPFAISSSPRATDASCSFGGGCARSLPTDRLHVGGRFEKQESEWHLRCILTVTD